MDNHELILILILIMMIKIKVIKLIRIKKIMDMIMKTTIILNNKVNFLLLSCSSGQNLLLTLFKLFKV